MDRTSTPDSTSSSLEGALLADTYQVVRRLGEGGMGVVYEARHVRVGSRHAIKVLRHKVASDPTLRARFEREAMLGSRLGHEHIVQVMDFDLTEDGFPFLVMELLQGEDLYQRLQREGPMSLVKAVSITRHVALALESAHREGVVHRDLKPENIFLTSRPTGGEAAKVLDFGLSKVLLSNTMGTQEGETVGSPAYMSPEQARGRIKEIDARSDIFSLGLVLYQMLSGRRAFSGKNLPALLYKVVHEPPPPLTGFRSDLPQGILRLVERATAKRRADRHATASELLEQLAAAMGSRWRDVLMLDVAEARPAASPAAPPSEQPRRLPPPAAPGRSGQRPGALLGLVLLLVVVLLVSLGGYLAYRHLSQEEGRLAPPAKKG